MSATDHHPNPASDQATDHASDQTPDHTPDQATDQTPDHASDLAADAAYAHEEAVRRANRALQTYTLSEDGWRVSPGQTVQRLLTDLLHWCDDTQRDFDAALERARAGRTAERGPDA